MLRRARFKDVIDRQLDLFASDEAPLLEEAQHADTAWTKADRDEAEERYGDYQLVVDTVGERLYDTREAYASTLDDHAAEKYRSAFNRAALKRFKRLASFLDEDE